MDSALTFYAIRPCRTGWKLQSWQGCAEPELLGQEICLFHAFEHVLVGTKPMEYGLWLYDDNKIALYLKEEDGNLKLVANEVLVLPEVDRDENS